MLTWIILVKLLLAIFFFVSYPWFHNTMFCLWYKHLTLVACVLGSSLIWTCRILNFECLFWFFPPRLPAENNNKYSIFKIQNLTSPNRWAAEDIICTCCYNMKTHLAWADFEIKVKQIALSTVHFDQWKPLISKMPFKLKSNGRPLRLLRFRGHFRGHRGQNFKII